MPKEYDHKIIKEYIARNMDHKHEMYRTDLPLIIKGIIHEKTPKTLERNMVTFMNNNYTFIKGTSKRTDKWVVDIPEQKIIHYGVFACPRCRHSHEMQFSKLKTDTYYDMCPTTRKPIIMRLE